MYVRIWQSFGGLFVGFLVRQRIIFREFIFVNISVIVLLYVESAKIPLVGKLM